MHPPPEGVIVCRWQLEARRAEVRISVRAGGVSNANYGSPPGAKQRAPLRAPGGGRDAPGEGQDEDCRAQHLQPNDLPASCAHQSATDRLPLGYPRAHTA